MRPVNLPVFLFLLLSFLPLLQALEEFQQRIPNGDAANREGSGITCQHLGHNDCQAGAPRNQFGLDFQDNDQEWTKELCEKDSDEDGLTNGEELGDPCCVWESGQPPARADTLSHPGDPNETGADAAPKCEPTPSLPPTATTSSSSESPIPTPSDAETPEPSSPLSFPTVVSAEPTPEPDDAVCFPAHSTVLLEDGRVKVMADLTVGDRVQVAVGEYSDVFMFTHRMPERVYEFITIRTGSDAGVVATVSLTKGHYLYVNGKLEKAGTVRVGDHLQLASGEKSRVIEVECANYKGLYNPQTHHGDLVVDGVRVSTYTSAVDTGIAHSLLAPLRVLYRMIGWSTSFLEAGADRIAAFLP